LACLFEDLAEQKSINRPTRAREVKERDVVILKEDRTPKCLWKLARIVDAIKGRDGAVRSARVTLLRGDRGVCLRRPMQHLILL